MVVVELIDPTNSNTKVLKLSPPITKSDVVAKLCAVVQGGSSGWVHEDSERVLIVPDKVLERSIITIREEKNEKEIPKA